MLRHIGSIPSPFPTKSLLTLLGLGALAVLLLWPSRSKPQSADPREQIRATKGAFVAQPPRYTAVPARAEIPLEQQMAERLLAAIESESDPARRDQIAETEAKHIPRALWGAVLNWLQEQPESASIAAALRGTMLRWAWEEPTGAAAWVIEHAAGDFRREALGIVGAGWARLQPDELKSWAARLQPTERDWVLLHAASYLGRTDLQQFAAWQSALPPSRERDRLLRDTARLWAGRAPLEVAALIARGPTDGDAEWRRNLAQALAGEAAAHEATSDGVSKPDALQANTAR